MRSSLDNLPFPSDHFDLVRICGLGLAVPEDEVSYCGLKQLDMQADSDLSGNISLRFVRCGHKYSFPHHNS